MRVGVERPMPLPSLPAGYDYELVDGPTIAKLIRFFNQEADFAISSQWTETIFRREVLSGAVPGGAIAITDNGGQPVAFGALWSDAVPRHGRIMYVLVSVQHRGNGFGRTITRRLLTIAWDNDFHWVVLKTEAGRTAAIRLYRSVGFRTLSQRQRTLLWIRAESALLQKRLALAVRGPVEEWDAPL